MAVIVKEEDSVIALDESSSELEVKKLRERWELASVLNFLNVRSIRLLFFFFLFKDNGKKCGKSMLIREALAGF